MTGIATVTGTYGHSRSETVRCARADGSSHCRRPRRADAARSECGEFGAVLALAALDIAAHDPGRGRADGAADAQALAAVSRLSRSRARLPPDGAHGVDVRRPGDRAAADRLPVLARFYQPRHRQLVSRRDQAGPERCAGAVALGPGPAPARAGAPHREPGALAARAARTGAAAAAR